LTAFLGLLLLVVVEGFCVQAAFRMVAPWWLFGDESCELTVTQLKDQLTHNVINNQPSWDGSFKPTLLKDSMAH
jgi:hypothetical protein